MNYGKSPLQKRKALISRSTMIGQRAHVSAIRVLFIALITIFIILLCGGIGAFKGIIDNAPMWMTLILPHLAMPLPL